MLHTHSEEFCDHKVCDDFFPLGSKSSVLSGYQTASDAFQSGKCVETVDSHSPKAVS